MTSNFLFIFTSPYMESCDKSRNVAFYTTTYQLFFFKLILVLAAVSGGDSF